MNLAITDQRTFASLRRLDSRNSFKKESRRTENYVISAGYDVARPWISLAKLPLPSVFHLEINNSNLEATHQ